MARSATILCALELERRVLADGLGDRDGVRVCVTGPGPTAVGRFLDTHWDEIASGVVLMAGVCGALHGRMEPGCAYAGMRVVTMRGGHWTTSWPASDAQQTAGLRMVTVLGADRPLVAASGKQLARNQTKADVVDTESHALAAWVSSIAQQDRGGALRWGVVRGVVDRHDESLPAGCERWIGSDGRLIRHRAALGLVTHPGSWQQISSLRQRTEQALAAVGTLIADLLERARQSDG